MECKNFCTAALGIERTVVKESGGEAIGRSWRETARRLCSDLLPIHVSAHEVWLLHVRVAGVAVAVRDTGVPDVSTIMATVVVRERGVVGGNPSRNVCGVGLLLLELSRVLVEQGPVVVPQTARGAQVIRRVEAGVRRGRGREERRGVRRRRPG